MTFRAFRAGRAGERLRRSRHGSFPRDWGAIPPARFGCRPIFAELRGFAPLTPRPTKPIPSKASYPRKSNSMVPGPMARNVADVALIHVAVTQQAELAPADLRGARIGLPRAYYWETLDADVAKIMDTTLDRLRNAGAVLVDIDFTDLIKTALAVRAPLRPED